MKRYLAIDIGASSGRHIVAWKEGGQLVTEEVYRFPNGALEEDGHLIWDIDALENSVRLGIEKARAAFPDIVSLSIDTWGVDYVLLKGDETVKPVYCYRSTAAPASPPIPSTRSISFTRIRWPAGWKMLPTFSCCPAI